MFFPFVEVGNAGTTKWNLWRLGLKKINNVIFAVVAILVTKYIYG